MSVDKKIVIIIIVFFMSLLTYLFYTKLYLENKTTISQIKRYETIKSSLESKKYTFSQKQLDTLKDKEKLLKSTFFTSDETNINKMTPYIKKILVESEIEIIQFQENKKTTRFIVKGTSNSLLDFLYKIHNENKYYDIPNLNIKMLNKDEFQGVIEVSRVILLNEPRTDHLTTSLKKTTIKLPYNSNIAFILGISLEAEEIIQYRDTVIPKKSIYKISDKFSYIGILKKDTKNITIFKDRNNSRIYQFELGKTISGWTYLGVKEGIYLFIKDNIKYEVKG